MSIKRKLLRACLLGWLAFPYGEAFSQEVAEAPGDAVTTEAKPLPQHTGRVPPKPQETRPKASQPERGEPSHSVGGCRSLPIPGQPARDLPEIGEVIAPEDRPPTLLNCLPHTGPRGALAGEVIYTGETFSLVHGGLSGRNVTNYRSNLDVVVTLDLEIAAGLKGARLFVYGQDLHGRPLSANDVGDIQLFSNIDSTISATDRPQYTTIAEYWYEQLLDDDRFRMKIGKQDANADFAYSDLGGDFIHSSFGLPPTIPLPTFPSQALGAAAFYSVTDEISIATGVYDGTPAGGPQGVRWGFDTVGDHGVTILTQIEILSQRGPNGQLPGTFRGGYWWNTANDVWADVSDPNRVFGSNDGIWLIADQMLWKEEYGTEDVQGLGAFVMYSWTHQDRSQLKGSVASGLVYRGLLRGRDDDLLGAGTAIASLSDQFIAAQQVAGTDYEKREIATEVFYKVQLAPYLTLQPEIQYITSPGGLYDDALLVGMRFEAAL
jgi:porin